MYPQADLNILAFRKRALMHRIRVRRDECEEHAHEVMKPAVWIAGLYAKWRAISPLAKLAAVPAGLFVARKFMPKLGGLLSWAPVAMNLIRALR
ncbi:MAG: hypothetical protein ACAH89_07790 [Rariglobus sp.]|nr:hypothetical protein [Rariglobus sp.]